MKVFIQNETSIPIQVEWQEDGDKKETLDPQASMDVKMDSPILHLSSITEKQHSQPSPDHNV